MELYESIRNSQAILINQNKASIVITRVTRTFNSSEGAWDEATSTLASQDVRIYSKYRYTKVINVSEAGWTLKKTQKMICKYDANILSESTTNLDTFTYNLKTYKVVDVQDILTQNYIVFKQCEIEAIT